MGRAQTVIEGLKIAHGRDYMDSLAVWNALTARAG